MTTLHQIVRRLGLRRGSRRRGTVLILALGVLAILSIAALSYVTVVRLDRAGVAAATQRGSHRAQADTVVQHLRDIITADLFGNKIVTADVPPIIGAVRNWPSMFEDGDSRDAPTIELSTFNTTANPADTPAPESVLTPGQPGRADNAFLASTEPIWTANPDLTRRWPQITNLNSAYRYDHGNPLTPADDAWVRGDGRFVDLAEWFLTPRNLYADPSINLRDWTAITPAGRLGPAFGINQDVYDNQINNMSGGSTPTFGAINPSDERQWVDTDGDLRPDARWTTLNALSGQAGLKWVVAARIIDASAFANINSSVEFGGLNNYGLTDDLGDGRTPADVDIARLFKDAATVPSGLYALQLADNRLFAGDVSFNSHLMEGLGMGRVIEDTNAAPIFPNVGAFNSWAPTAPSTPDQRIRYWEYFGQSPGRPDPLGRRGGGYPVRDLVDLASFWGVNSPSIVSLIEQHIDGTEDDGYLPNDTRNFFGPLRAKESSSDIRHLVTNAEASLAFARPTGSQIMESARRLITPVSGSGLQSPVPVLNPQAPFVGTYRTDKVRISAPPATQAETERLVRESFQALVWALAPSATDRPLNRAAYDSNSYAIPSEDAHYGGFNGADTGPGYRSAARHLYDPAAFGGIGNPLASYAVITAVSMATNLIDAIDAATPGTVEPPTVVALYNSIAPDSPAAYNAIPLGTNLAQGVIPAGNLPWIDASDPYLIVGLDRQPFLREVTTVAVFSDHANDRLTITTDKLTGNSQDEALGSAVIVVLTNPWSTAIAVGSEYHIVIPEADGPNEGDPRLIDDSSTPAILPFRMSLPAQSIPAESSATFVWLFSRTSLTGDAWDSIKTHMESSAGYGTDVFYVDDASITPLPDAATNRVPFFHLAQNPQPRRVLLTYTTNPGANPDLVLDSLRPPVGEIFPRLFPGSVFDFTSDVADNVGGGFDLSWFRDSLGYLEADLLADTRYVNRDFTGRLLTSSCLSRPSVRRNGSFPATVIENRAVNNVTNRIDAHGWMYPPLAADTAQTSSLRDNPDSIVSGSTLIAPSDYPNQHLRGSDDGVETFADDSSPYGAGGVDLPIFNLFVPNSGIRFASDMLRIGIYAHTCRNAAASIENLDHWRTAGEKLGASIRYFYGDTLSPNIPNSYLGVLDPSRYVPGGDLNGYADMPDTMKIPLALRVPDCFEAAPIRETTNLVHGRININTAPRQVLEVLPLISPAYDIPGISGMTGIPASIGRADLIEAYRSAAEGEDSFTHSSGTILNRSELPFGLRPDRPSNNAAGTRTATSGFVTPAELAILGQWEVNAGVLTGLPVGTQVGTFLEVGADGLHNNFPPIQARPPMGGLAEQIGVDDPAERLAFYRAVSNIATARSDVFIAWFVIRGYDPQTIERINMLNANPTIDDAIAAMDNPDNGFVPVYESRWLVVLDRSQTESGAPLRLPTDRPRVLMQVELPSVRP